MRLILLWLVCFPFSALGQNLVANGSFEDENICSEYTRNCSPEAWIISSLQSNFYFDDAANAYDGNHFVGLVAGVNGKYSSRNFIRSQLLCGMRKDAWYKVEFYLRDGIERPDSIGVAFTADDLLYRKWGMKDQQPDLWVKDGLTTGGNTTWKKFSALYHARGDESFIGFALFKKSKPERRRNLSDPDFYVFIDHVSVTPVDPNEKLCPQAAANKEALYAFNDRHEGLDQQIYPRQHREPQKLFLPKTIVQRIDTLVIPDVLFAIDKYNLSKKAVQLLDSFTTSHRDVLVDSIVVSGHTDSTGSIAHNEELSRNRAGSVAEYLKKSFAADVISRGYASLRPVADNRTSGGRQKNRRVEIYLYVRE